MASFEARTDLVRNRLYIKTAGFPTESEMEQHARRIVAELAKLRTGFVVIADITEMKATTPAGAAALLGLLQEYKRRGISRIVRIVSDEVLAKMQLQRITQEADIPVVHVTSLAAADALLSAARSAP
jgi:hypothetical protein